MEAGAKNIATASSLPAAGKEAAQKKGEESWLRKLGPGLITGAADDDPSGIAAYSQVGVQFGLGMLWTVLFSFPLMSAIRDICARLGRITGSGIAASVSRRFPKPLVIFLVTLLCAANIFNLGADVAAMGAATQLLAGGIRRFTA